MKKIFKRFLFLLSLSFVLSYLGTSIFFIFETKFTTKENLEIVAKANEESKIKLKKFNELKSVVYIHKTYYALESFFSGKTLEEVNQSYTISKKLYLLKDFSQTEIKDNFCVSMFVFEDEEQLICEVYNKSEYIGDLMYIKQGNNWTCEYYGDKTIKPKDCI